MQNCFNLFKEILYNKCMHLKNEYTSQKNVN